jgi:heme A synthase
MRMLFFAHSGLRYLVLLVGFIALLYLAYALFTKKGEEKLGRTLGSVFVGLLDLQMLLGILMVVLGNFYPALIGHLAMMVGAVVVGHGAMAMAKTAEPAERRNALRFGGVLVALLLIIGGIMAIGRSVFGSGVPSI